MDSTSHPGHGAIVTYLNPDVHDPAAFLCGIVVGAHVVDPKTDHAWVPVLLPDGTLSVLDSRHIIEVHASDEP